MSERDALYRAVCSNPHDDTPRLLFADHLEEYGEPERAAFIRAQCELSGYVCYGGDDVFLGLPDAQAAKYRMLRDRESKLFAAHGRQWFGANAVLYMTTSLLGAWLRDRPYGLEVSRGFPSHWLGPWSEWVDVECRRCQGRGSLHNDMHHSPDTCSSCHGDGRIPGACYRAWKPSWTMECENCGGFGEFRRRHDNGDGPEGPCPDCGGKWNSGPHIDPEDYWDKGTGRIPRPFLPDVLPITDVTLTTRPTPVELARMVVQLNYAQLTAIDSFKKLLLDRWPGITFHLPQGAMR